MQTLSILTTAQVQDVIRQIDALSAHWEQRHHKLPFYTLGAASYLDSFEVFNARYYRKVTRLNPVLERHFSWLYELVIQAMREATGKPCALADGQALPGFHIFLAHPQFLEPVASKHIDLQHKTLNWPRAQSVSLEQGTLSFTLALELPQSGGGLNTWSVSHEELLAKHFWSTTLGSTHIESELSFIEYKPGHMVVHSGELLHQIAPPKELQPTDRRITLQGHGVLSHENTYLLYW